MKIKGIVRRTDELGRIVLPKEIRTMLKINVEDPLEILVDDCGQIVLRKFKPACVFCNNMDGVTMFKGRNVCHTCLEQIAAEKI